MHEVWPAGERVLVSVNHHDTAQALGRKAWRIAQGLHSELLAVFVETPRAETGTPEQWRQLEENLRYAEDLGAKVIRVKGSDVAGEIARIARDNNVANIVIGHTSHGRLRELFRGNVVNRLISLTPDIDVLVVTTATE